MNAVLAVAGFTSPTWLAPALFAGAMVLLIAAMVRRQQLIARRGGDELLTPAARYHARRGAGRGRESLRVTMADAEELAARLTAMIDEAAGRAQRALADLEDRIQTLERLEARAKRRGIALPGDGGAVVAALAAPPEALPPNEPSLSPVEKRILDLAAQGRTPVEIAKETGRPTGQVELIIALRRERSAVGV